LSQAPARRSDSITVPLRITYVIPASAGVRRCAERDRAHKATDRPTRPAASVRVEVIGELPDAIGKRWELPALGAQRRMLGR
jgi:hypothetical protein